MESMVFEDDDNNCPICCGPMDETDYRLFPCPCGFQICMWCLNTLQAENERCPNCRSPYNRNNYRIIEESDSEDSSCEDEFGNSISREKRTMISKMQQTRIIQRNLVYVVGISAEDSNTDELRSENMFGKYGPIQKVVLGSPSVTHPKSTTIGIYLTFENDVDALHCIEAVDGFSFKGHLLKASFGTTKYCNSFIKGVECTNPDCLYLHKEAPKSDCFLRDEMTIGDYSFYKATHPGHGSYWDRQQHLFLYYRRSIHRSGYKLPDYREHGKTPVIIFGLNPHEMDQIILPRKNPFSIKLTSDIVFSAEVADVTDVPKNHGEMIDLNELFGISNQEKSMSDSGYRRSNDRKRKDGYRKKQNTYSF